MSQRPNARSVARRKRYNIAVDTESGCRDDMVEIWTNRREESLQKKRRENMVLRGCSGKLGDRISGLPDDILVLILSLLTVKEAIVTSVLARRWRYMYASLPCLNFDVSILRAGRLNAELRFPFYGRPLDKEISEFTNFVNGVLRCHKSDSLEEFRLRFFLRSKQTPFINSCFKFALQKKVKRLELDFSLSGRPHSLKNYNFQVGVSNNGHHQRGAKLLWSFDGFKSLKSLHFDSVMMDGHVLEGLVSNCPVLEIIRLRNMFGLCHVKVVGPSLRLKQLHILECYDLRDFEIYDVPLLVSLSLWRCGGANIAMTMDKVPRLVDLSLTTSLTPVDEFPLLTSCLLQLESLRVFYLLHHTKVEENNILRLQQHSLVRLLFRLTKLRELEVICDSSLDIFLVVPLIEAAPYVPKIVMRTYDLGIGRRDRLAFRPLGKGSSVGVLGHLKVLEYAGYGGNRDENELILYVINNAPALETVIISTKFVNPICKSECELWCLPGIPKINMREEQVRVIAKQELQGVIPKRVELVIR